MKYSTQYLIPALVVILAFFLLVPEADALDYHDQIGCLAGCHDLHGAPAPDPSLGGPLLRDATVNQTCLNCHATEQTNRGGETIPPISTHMTLSCTQCHDPHKNRDNFDGSTNVKLVGPSLDSNGNVQGNYLAQIQDDWSGGWLGGTARREVRYTGACDTTTSDYPFQIGNNDATQEGICSSCHDPSTSANHHGRGMGMGNGPACLNCHGSGGGGGMGGGGGGMGQTRPWVVYCTKCHEHASGFTSPKDVNGSTTDPSPGVCP